MKKKMFLMLFLILFLMLFIKIKEILEIKNATYIKINKIIILPEKRKKITCTGLFYDETNRHFYIGNAGKEFPEEKNFHATIEIISKDFLKVIKTIECYKFFPKLKDIQGVTKGIGETLWFCSYGENKVRNIDMDGNLLFEFNVNQPTGITFDSRNKNLWILTNDKLINYSAKGKEIKNYSTKIKGQDQIFLDEKNDILYITAGTNYQKENYIYSFNLKDQKIKLAYIPEASFAIEGISIVENNLYILNDGYYHKAKLPFNQVNIYKNFNKY